MLVVVKKKINNLIKISPSNTFTNLINANYQDLLKNLNTTNVSKKTHIYKCLNTYLLNNNYTIKEIELIDYLKTYQTKNNHFFTYKEINKIKKILTNILTEKFLSLIKKETSIQIEKNKITKAIEVLNNNKDISINKYYQITENTPNYALSFLNTELNKLNNEKVFIAFNITLNSQEKELNTILNTTKKEKLFTNLLLNNLISSIKQIPILNISLFYQEIITIEKLLNQDKIYKSSTENSKKLYRKKILKKHNPSKYLENILTKEEHIGFYLFKKPSPIMALDYNDKIIKPSSKTTVNISKYFTDKESIDIFFQELENNLTPNIDFSIINKNLLLDEELIIYLNQKCNNLNISSNPKSSKSKYIINLNNIEKIDLTAIKSLIGILDHPINQIVFDNNKNTIKKGIGHLLFHIKTKNKNLFTLSYQKELDHLTQNEIYNLKAYNKITTKHSLKNNYLKRKYLNSKYIKKIFFSSNDNINYTTYLNKYHNFLKENIHILKKTNLKQKLILLTTLKKIFIYFLFLISIIIYKNPILLILELLAILILSYQKNIYLTILKSINEYSHIPIYLFLPLVKKHKKFHYIINILISIILLIFHNYLGLIFLLAFPLKTILTFEKKHSKQQNKFNKDQTIDCPNSPIPPLCIISNNNLSLYINNEANVKSIYQNTPLKDTNYQKALSIIDLKNDISLPLKNSQTTILNNKSIIENTYSKIKLNIEITISQIKDAEINKITIKNNDYQNKHILIKYPLSYNKGDTFIYKKNKYLTIKKNNSNTYLTTYFLTPNNKYDLSNPNQIILNTEEKIKSTKEKELYLITIITTTPPDEQTIKSFTNTATLNTLFSIQNKPKETTSHQILSYLYQINKFKINDSRKTLLSYNNLDSYYLKKFNIKQDIPLIILDLENKSNPRIIKDTILLFKYCKINSFNLNLIILNNKDPKYTEELIYHLNKENKCFLTETSNIFFLTEKDLSQSETILLYTLSYLTINASNYYSLEEYLKKLETTIQLVNTPIYKIKKSNPIELPNIENINESGYFNENTKEYFHNNNLSDTLITNTIAAPSSLKVITNNHLENITYINDYLKLSSKEEIIINNTKLQFSIINTGLGYTTYYAKTKKLEITLTEFISYFEKIKFIYFNIKNTSTESIDISIKYLISPLLSEKFPNSNRYILSNYDNENNIITMQNKLNKYFQNNTCFITCTEKIKSVDLENPIQKTIEINKTIPNNTTKELSFTIGISDLEHLTFIKEKYSNTATITTSLAITKNYFKTLLNTIKVSTNDTKFNNIINNYLLYKTITEKTFQSNYHQRLKNSFNIINPLPESTKETILSKKEESLNKEDIFYLTHTIMIYIKKTEEESILNELITPENTLYNILEKNINLLNENNNNKYLYYKTLENFIEISKIYNKNIDTKIYKEKLKSLKEDFLNKKQQTIIDKTYKILLDITDNNTEQITCNKKLLKNFKNKEILYLYLLIKLQKYDLLYKYIQKINPFYNKHTQIFNKYTSNLYQIIIEEILGFQKKGKKLYINPHLPITINDYTITYTYLNTIYNIHIIINTKENKIIINDLVEEIDYIELKNDYKQHNITIYRTQNKTVDK